VRCVRCVLFAVCCALCAVCAVCCVCCVCCVLCVLCALCVLQGSVEWAVYLAYLKAAGGIPVIITIILLAGSFQVNNQPTNQRTTLLCATAVRISAVFRSLLRFTHRTAAARQKEQDDTAAGLVTLC
jgi:hypothetical protein